jgi:hypothetical protein
VYVITMSYTHKFYVTYGNILKYSYIIYDFDNSDGKTVRCKAVNSEFYAIPDSGTFRNHYSLLFNNVIFFYND